MAHEDALTFIDNHDTERGVGEAGDILNFKEPKPYKGAIAFLLAHPYGEPQIMSSYHFWNDGEGPPMDSSGNIISPSINSVSCNNCNNLTLEMKQFLPDLSRVLLFFQTNDISVFLRAV